MSFHAQAVNRSAHLLHKPAEFVLGERRRRAARNQRRNRVGTQPDRGQNRRRSRIGVDAVPCSVHGEAVHQAAARDQAGARRIRDGIKARADVEVAVIISDTFGRTWRRGLTDVAIGCAGIGAILDLRGSNDTYGREMLVTEVAVVDELASAAELVMGKASGIPVAIVRGIPDEWLRKGDVRSEIIRPPDEDLFR